MTNLKIKVNLGAFNVELEGSADDVISQFSEIKQNGLGQMVDQLIPLFVQNKKIINDNVLLTSDSNENLLPLTQESNSPDSISLKDVVIKDLPQNEPEWVLIYSHFICIDGKTEFTKDEIISKYVETKRKTESRMKNFATSLKRAVKKNWIRTLNDTEYLLTDNGRTLVSQILTRASATTKVSKKKKKQTD